MVKKITFSVPDAETILKKLCEYRDEDDGSNFNEEELTKACNYLREKGIISTNYNMCSVYLSSFIGDLARTLGEIDKKIAMVSKNLFEPTNA